MSFSDRVLNHPRITKLAATAGNPLTLAVDNQLLVCTSAANAVHQYLDARGISWELITTLLEGLDLPPVLKGEDVEILHVDLPPTVPNIFELTSLLRKGPLDAEDERKVSPNHILIPAVEDHCCPAGPPGSATGRRFPVLTDPPQIIIIIDSGYQWNGDWGENPLDAYAGPIAFCEANRLVDPTGWQGGTPDVPDANQPGVLDALSGHANFIAGVIAQRSQHALISVLNHNGAFRPFGDDLPTEAGVARALCSCRGRGAKVINLGFAFAAFNKTASCAWDIAFAQIGEGTIGNGPLVVSPAGNQASPIPRYPAALASQYSVYENMIGVGSTQPLPNELPAGEFPWPPLEGELYSNYGPWVTCSANGSLVHSTFLRVNMMVEDDPSALSPTSLPHPVDFESSWATWSGTSFSTPKVVAEIVNAMVEQNLAPHEAWEWVRDNVAVDKHPELGYILPF